MYVTKETKWHPQWCCHSTFFGSSLFLSKKTNIPICHPWNETKGATWNRHSSHIVLTPINRLCGEDGSWLETTTGNFCFLLRQHQWSNRCHGNGIKGGIVFLLWCTFMVPSFKNTASIFPEISIQYFTILVANNMTSSLI